VIFPENGEKTAEKSHFSKKKVKTICRIGKVGYIKTFIFNQKIQNAYT